MFDIRRKVEQTRQFVREHPTVSSCVATAVVTAYVVHDREITALKRIAVELLQDQHERNNLLMDITSFVDHKGLRTEFLNFAPHTQE
jgi:hypothetical protein